MNSRSSWCLGTGTSGVTIAIINHYRKPLQAIQPSLSHHLAMIKASKP
jgi:hypothetical protein